MASIDSLGLHPDEPPDMDGLIVGVRTWQLANCFAAEMGGQLWSLVMLDCWRKDEEWKVAKCNRNQKHRKHGVPGVRCSCGIWAFNSPDEAGFQEMTLPPPPPALPSKVPDTPYMQMTGVIGAQGAVIDCDFGGFRAQDAKVLAIFDDPFDTPKKKAAGEHNADIIDPDDYDDFCANHDRYRLIRLDRP
jgi:hypothetical protein